MSAGAARERGCRRALRANGGVGGLTACRPSLRYHLLDEWRVREPAADKTVSDIIEIEIESSPGPRRQLDHIIDAPSMQAVFEDH